MARIKIRKIRNRKLFHGKIVHLIVKDKPSLVFVTKIRDMCPAKRAFPRLEKFDYRTLAYTADHEVNGRMRQHEFRHGGNMGAAHENRHAAGAFNSFRRL